jgi:phosphatidylglycerophosphate synthase
MTTAGRKRRLVSIGALAIGAILFVGTLYYIDLDMLLATGRRLGIAVPLALLASGAWHLTRTWAWSWCFLRPRKVRFLRLLRVRLAAEAFSYLTVAGVAGEPLKVVLLNDRVPAREATAAVALERIAYMIGTTLIVGVGSLIAMATQPLSPIWLKIFRGFAIGSGAMAIGIAMILIRRDSYLLSAFRAADRAAGTHFAAGKLARFAADVGRQLGELVRGNGARLAVLTTASIVAYGCMSAEAYLILRAVGIPITFTGALVIETFSRVASFASAFIPASIGALEASSLAAVTAVGAGAAGAPLALARRLRGLFWAGVGLAIYPRGARPSPAPAATKPPPDNLTTSGPILLYLPSDALAAVSPFARVAGLAVAERVMRSAFRARYARVLVLADPAMAPKLSRIARDIRGRTSIVTSEAAWQDALGSIPGQTAVTAIGGGLVVSPALLEDAGSLNVTSQAPRDVPAGSEWPVSGVLRVRAEDARDITQLAGLLRERRATAAALPTGVDVSQGRGRLVLRLAEPADIAVAEQTIRRSSYKNTDNTLARFNRRMSLPISIALIRTPLTANQLSVALVALGFYSAWLFSLGHYWPGVLGAFLSLAASVLDGCDGEIARLKYQESALGCWIETFGDYSYYIAIFAGLTVGAAHRTGWEGFYWLGAVALAGTLVTFGFLIYLRSRITAGQPDKLHSIARDRFKAEPSWWSRIIWRISFVATRSAMPYGIVALSLLGLLPLVIVLAAIGSNTYWISLVLKLRHLLGDDEEFAVSS